MPRIALGPCWTVSSLSLTGELREQWRRRLRKRHLKSAFANFIALIPSRLNSSNVGKFWGELNSKGLYQSLGKEKESCCLVFPSLTKREIRHFHVVVVQSRQRNVQKSVMHVQSRCFANLNLLLICCSSCRRRRRCFSSPQVKEWETFLPRFP